MNIATINRIFNNKVYFDKIGINNATAISIDSMIEYIEHTIGKSKPHLDSIKIDFDFGQLPSDFTLDKFLLAIDRLYVPKLDISKGIPRFNPKIEITPPMEFLNITTLSLNLTLQQTYARDFEYILKWCPMLSTLTLIAIEVLDDEDKQVTIFSQALIDHKSLTTAQLFLDSPESDSNVIKYVNSNSTISDLIISFGDDANSQPTDGPMIANTTLKKFHIDNDIRYYQLWNGMSNLESIGLYHDSTHLLNREPLVKTFSLSHRNIKQLEFTILGQDYLDTLAEIIGLLEGLERLCIFSNSTLDSNIDIFWLLHSITNHNSLEYLSWDNYLLYDSIPVFLMEQICEIKNHPSLKTLKLSISSSPDTFIKNFNACSIENLIISNDQIRVSYDESMLVSLLNQKENLKSLTYYYKYDVKAIAEVRKALLNYFQTHSNPILPPHLKIYYVDAWKVYLQAQKH
ncbi:hypothetical protein DLAC_03009 [Tieghemostelium lacteum]|uniref:Uncharacterized protein n=1 Tax=Tieghemostelium lacteum TaxID=361077 RepID=A0A152A401_TIELA|nr:hypothetical protein DLAC_03009 [Tieghemostelium lacteum]|eukprot:KYR00944.1 hypothetical protein DLAC_03009 [Tieghemostelium lacteum]